MVSESRKGFQGTECKEKTQNAGRQHGEKQIEKT